jgi:pimeloyl-ACP methyl ester carboxylesterase
MPEERTFAASAVNLNYLDYGPPPEGAPLVMLHGGAWRWQEYLSLLPTLGRDWHIHALDLRGNGRSGWVPSTYRLRNFVQDNVEFLEALQVPAVVAGHSIGGVIALMMAARCPRNVRALIVEDVPLTLDNYQRIIDSSRSMFTLWLELKKAARSEQDLALRLADSFRDVPTITSQWLMFFAACLWQLDPTFFGNLLGDFADFAEGYDYENILGKLDCPILFLRGETGLGAVMTDHEIDWLQSNFSNVRCALIAGVGHLLHMEDHGQAPVLAEMLSFLNRV